MASFNYTYSGRMRCEHDWRLTGSNRKGIFYGEVSIVRLLPFTMLRLALFFTLSQSLHRFLKPFKQIQYISNVLAGIILGPSILGRYEKYNGIVHIPSHVHFNNVMAYVGLLYHVFVVAVKTDTTMVLRFRKQFWIMGISSMFAQFLTMSILLAILKPVSTQPRMYIYVFALQTSSTWFINLVSLIDELNLFTTELGQLALSLALTNELMMYLCAFVILVSKTYDQEGLLKSMLPLGVLAFVILGVVRPTVLWVIKRIPRGETVRDIYVVGIFLGAGITASICDILVGAPTMGIIFMGLVVPHGPPLGLAIVERCESFIKICLLPFFYLAIGDSVHLEVFESKGQAIYQAIIIFGHLTKILTITMSALWYNLKPQTGFALGVIMNTSGVIHIMSYWTQWIRKRTDYHISSQLILSSVVVTVIATPLALYFHKQSKKDSNSVRGFQLSVQSALMSSKMHVLICLDNEDDIMGIINLIKATNPTEAHPVIVCLVHLVELVGQAAPLLVPHQKHTRLCKYNGCVHIMNAIKGYTEKEEDGGGLTIDVLTMVAPFMGIYESICKIAHQKMIPLIIVPFNYKSLSEMGNSASSQLNCKLQQQTPCTLGIYVNKDGRSNKQLNQQNFSYNVAVIFCGGEDDREVLAYATRMSTHPCVSVTILRIFVKEFKDYENEDGISLDNSAIERFKDSISNNCNSNNSISESSSYNYEEFHVEEWLETLNVIQNYEKIKNYDLVMVGRRHGKKVNFEDELYVLSENPELGGIGELLVSSRESQWQNTSILVMQHCIGYDKARFGNVVYLDDDDS